MLSRHLIKHDAIVGYSLSSTVLRGYATAMKQMQGNDTASTPNDWENARPYSELQGPSKYEMIRGVLPGGVFYKKTFIEGMTGMAKKYGDVFRIPAIFGKPEMVLDFNPNDYPIIFRNEGIWPERRSFEAFIYYRKVHREDIFRGVTGLLTTTGEEWAKIRTAVNPVLMQPKNAKLYLNTLLEVNDEFLERIRHIRDPLTLEVPDDFQDDINRLTLESVVGIALNTRLGMIHNNRDNPESKIFLKEIRNLFELSEKIEIKPSIWKIIKTPKFHQLMKTLDTLTVLCNKYIDEALKQIVLDTEGKLTSEVDKEKSVLEKLLRIDRRIAVVMALDMIMAGVDTTSSTLTGILFCIAKNPEKQQKLFKELKNILPNKDSRLTIDNMQNLPYHIVETLHK
ncbi:cytochrome P450 CYP12A2 [Bactrocera oleae]|uniref:cytochrome P450 CYP12A2 n=1 Tax=Bactrocera oleae TaxID=104688 RepID=UPI0006B70630|nr:cytochrome P450 CYP12A2-like [Bactrocera oleae]